jgi:hypothetical protein
VAGNFARLQNGDFIVRHGRVVRYGLCEGSPDLVGYLPIIVTPEMVGAKIAVFVGAEAKFGRGRLSGVQKSFQTSAKADGGICFDFSTTEEALGALHV